MGITMTGVTYKILISIDAAFKENYITSFGSGLIDPDSTTLPHHYRVDLHGIEKLNHSFYFSMNEGLFQDLTNASDSLVYRPGNLQDMSFLVRTPDDYKDELFNVFVNFSGHVPKV